MQRTWTESTPVGQPHMDTWTSKDTNVSDFLVAMDSLSARLPQFPYRDTEAANRIDIREFEWFFESPEFNQWGHESGMLWLSGIPGSGKTTLSFHLWDSLKRNQTFNTTEDIVAFFWSYRKAPADNQAAQILSTIVNQLLHSNRKRLELVAQQCPVPKLSRQPTPVSPSQSFLDELWNILLVSVMVVPTCPVTIIIDGIDELRTEGTRQMFCKNLLLLHTELASKGIRGFKIFITARPYNDIKKVFTGVLNVERDKERQRK